MVVVGLWFWVGGNDYDAPEVSPAFVLFCFFLLCPWHAEVPRSGIEPAPQQ